MPSYKSVTEQAGIYAGKEGFDIKVENNTDLKGAVIASEAEADKNTLTTGTISFSDIKNEAEYDTKGIGMTLDANKTSGNQPSTVGQKGLIPTVPASVGDSAESTTKSGVSEGKINVTKPEKQKQDVNTLNRDTKNTLNKLDQIFDIEKIREDQETAALFGELAANGIHVLAEKNKWKNDDPEKIALHAAVGAVIASITKGNIPAGALTGGATEYLANEILKACKGDKALTQWVSIIVGAAFSKSTGGSAQQGAFVALNAIKNNGQLEYDDFDIPAEQYAEELLEPYKELIPEEQYYSKLQVLTMLLENQQKNPITNAVIEAINGGNMSDVRLATFAIAQAAGGLFELSEGIGGVKKGSTVFTKLGYALVAADGPANFGGALGKLTGLFNGDGEEYDWNYMRAAARTVLGDCGEILYDGSQAIYAIGGSINSANKITGFVALDRSTKTIIANVGKDEAIEGNFFAQPIIIGDIAEYNGKDLVEIVNTLTSLLNIGDVMSSSTKSEQTNDDY